jgi:hypothetical protein
MPTLVPVDFDPFTPQPQGADPFSGPPPATEADPFAKLGHQPKFVPVDHDPFATAPAEMPQPQPQGPLQPREFLPDAKAVLRGYAQGRSFGFADEMRGALGTPVAKLGLEVREAMGGPDAPSMGDLYRSSRDRYRAADAQAAESAPVPYYAGVIAGGVKSGRNLPAVTPFQGTTAAQRVGNAIATGGAYAAPAALGESKADLTKGEYAEAFKDVRQGVAGGAGSGALLQGGAEKLNRVGVKQPTITADEIKAMANSSYSEAAQKGGILKPEVTDRFIDYVNRIAPQTAKGKALTGDSQFSKLVERINQFRGQPTTLQEVQEIDEAFGDAIDGFFKDGKLQKEGKKIMDLQTAFRKQVEKALPSEVIGGKEGFDALKQGRALWSQQAKMRDIERILERASMTDNPATAIKNGFRTLYFSNRIRGYSAEERKLIAKAAKGSLSVDVLRTLGSRLILIAEAAKGGGIASTAATAAATTGMRRAATRVQEGKAGRVAQAITRGVPGAPLPPETPDLSRILFRGGQLSPVRP